MFSWSTLPRPILCLAPMAGYTDSPYRQIMKSIAPRVICFTEFTSVDGLLHDNQATLRQVTFNAELERPLIAQIFGKKPEHFFRAAGVLKNLGVDAIDINMGCPAKKIISSDCGSSLLKEPALAEEIVRATVEGAAQKYPAAPNSGTDPLEVSVKMRIGTSCFDADYFFNYAQRMERAGAKLITVHGRTSKQMYSGTADWTPMYELKKILSIPVIGNGDIRSGADAVAKIGNLDGVMVGRGSFGNPWVFTDIEEAFAKNAFTAPALPHKIMTMMRHFELSCNFYGDGLPSKESKRGILEMRKQIAWYLRGFPHASELRQQLMKIESREEVLSLMHQFLATGAPAPALPLTPHG